jgi:hypothetical protein
MGPASENLHIRVVTGREHPSIHFRNAPKADESQGIGI